jgi:hypothetical protein
LNSHQYGGPLLDRHGNTIGFNVGGKTSSYAVSAEIMQLLVEDLVAPWN